MLFRSDFTYFSDKEGMGFKVNSTPDGSFVMPEYPFSLLDKMETLKSKGWTHQLIDFSKTKILKSDIRNLVSIIQKHEFIEGASRFNWKNGFYILKKWKLIRQLRLEMPMIQKTIKSVNSF